MLSLQWCPGTTRENVSPVKKKRTGTPSPSISPSPNNLGAEARAPPLASAPPSASAPPPPAPTPTSPPASPAAPKSASSDGETWFFNCRCGEKGWGLDDGTAQWQCEKCHSWQHERCVSIGGGGVPSPYLCHECAPVAAPTCVLARAAARPLEPEKSQYEIERDERIKRNADFLASLGLGGGLAPAEEKKKVKKPAVKKRKAEPREPARKSSRVRGEAAKDYVAEDGGDDDAAAAWTPRAARAPRGKRLPAAAVAELERQCGEVRSLTAAERAAADVARAGLAEYGNAAGRARAYLATVENLRRPRWLETLEASSILAGKSQSNRDKVMVVLEKCAAGLGVGAVAWPSPFLCDAELPMTLGSDVEMLKYCGKRLECAHGADISNGWAYSHAFGKLKAYQTALLGEAAFDAPPLSELDDDAVEALVPDHIKAVCAARPVTPEPAPAPEGGAAPAAPEAAAAPAAPEPEPAATPESEPAATPESERAATPPPEPMDLDGGTPVDRLKAMEERILEERRVREAPADAPLPEPEAPPAEAPPAEAPPAAPAAAEAPVVAEVPVVAEAPAPAEAAAPAAEKKQTDLRTFFAPKPKKQPEPKKQQTLDSFFKKA